MEKIYPSLEEAKKFADYTVVPVKRELFADIRTPVAALKILKNTSSHVFILESVENQEKWGRYTFLGYDPKLEISCLDGVMNIKNIATGETESFPEKNPAVRIKSLLDEYRAPQMDGFPSFTGGLVGYFGYDYIKYAEPCLKLYAEDAVPTAKPTLAPANKNSKGNGKSYSKYKLVVDVSDQRVYAYGYENGAYGPLARVMICSTGTKSNPTPLGTFKGSGPSHRWHYFEKFECYAQYSWRIDGPILFHSVLYNEIDGSPTSSSVRNLGRRASHGCIRLSVEDAKWIYNNCASGTTVVVRE